MNKKRKIMALALVAAMLASSSSALTVSAYADTPEIAVTETAEMNEATVYYTLDHEDATKTYINSKDGTTTDKGIWASQYFAGGMSMATDSDAAIGKYFKYHNSTGRGTRCAYLILEDEAGTVDENKKAVVEFDFKFKNGGTNGNNQLVLIGNSATPIQNGDYEPTNKPAGTAAILKMTQPKGEGGQFFINNTGATVADATVKSAGYVNDTWAHAKAVMNFENKSVLLTITSLDGATTYVETSQVAMDADAEKLSQLFVAAARDNSNVNFDNVVVRSVEAGDITGTYYNVKIDVDGKESVVGVKEGNTLESLPDTTKTGYIFDGWKIDDEDYLYTNDQILDTTVAGDMTITAMYHKDPDYIEPMVDVQFSSFPAGNIFAAGADENTAADNIITVKLTGEIGTDLIANPDDRVTDLDVKWTFKGFRHIASKAAVGENAATTDAADSNEYCDSYAEVVYDETNPTSVNFKLKSQAFNFYGEVEAVVTYNGKTMTITKPVAIIPTNTQESDVILPVQGYVTNFDWYSDDMVGYKATISADNKSATDVVTGNWAAYGGNTGRGLYLASDEGGKFLKLKSTGTNSSSFAVNKLAAAPTGQVIIKQDVKFYNPNSAILFKSRNPVDWAAGAITASMTFSGSSIDFNAGGKIADIAAGKWYTIVFSVDPTSKLSFAKVYDKETGELLGSSDVLPFSDPASITPTYLCYRTPDNANGELDFNNVIMYTPKIDNTKFVTTVADETLSIPEEGAADAVTSLTASAFSTEGYDMIGAAKWEIADSSVDTTKVILTPDVDNSHNATLTVKAGASSGELPISVTIGGVTKTINVNLTSSQDNVKFTSSTSSISIPLDADSSNEAIYTAKVVNGKGEELEGKTVTYAVYDKNNVNPLETLPKGITFDNATGKLTVTPDATACVIYVRATGENTDGEVITKAVKVTIHGLAFDFGSGEDDAVVEGYTAVTPSTAYSDAAGYGIENGAPTVEGTPTIDNADSDNLTGAFTFKTKVVPAKVYKVTVNYKGNLVSEKVTSGSANLEKDLSGVALSNAAQTTVEYTVPVIDDVLDLTFSGGCVASIVIDKLEDKTQGLKPHIYTVGDSTIANNGSWAYVLNRDFGNYSNLSELASFSNNGRGGKNLSSYYTGGEFRDRVLTNVRPGDIVMIGDMGTNGMGQAFEEAFNYYIDACEAMGAKIIINSYSPHGAKGDYEWVYNKDTQTFNGYRQDAYDVIVRKIYDERTTVGNAKYDSNIIGFVDIGKMADDAFNAYVDDFEANSYASRDAAAQAIISCFGDHNHYSSGPLAAQLMIEGYKDASKGIVKSLVEILSATPVEQKVIKFSNKGNVVSTAVLADGELSITELPTVNGSATENFIGWFTAPEGGEAVTLDTLKNITSDVTVYARYENVKVEATVLSYQDGKVTIAAAEADNGKTYQLIYVTDNTVSKIEAVTLNAEAPVEISNVTADKVFLWKAVNGENALVPVTAAANK